MAKVRVTERVLTEHKIEVEAPIEEYFTVEDFVEFGRQLVTAKAPANHPVSLVTKTGENGGHRVKRLLVDWHEDLINGQPAPQAMETAPERNPS